VATAVFVLVAMQAPVAWAGPTVHGGVQTPVGADPVVPSNLT